MQYISHSSPDCDTFYTRANGIIASSNFVSGVWSRHLKDIDSKGFYFFHVELVFHS